MTLDYDDNNRQLLEKRIKNIIVQLCKNARINIDEWDFDEILAAALLSSNILIESSKLRKELHGIFNIVKDLKIQLSGKLTAFECLQY